MLSALFKPTVLFKTLMTIRYLQLSPKHFKAIISLGEQVHGENYLDLTSLTDLYERGVSGGVNASWVALEEHSGSLPSSKCGNRITEDGYLIGFRITIAAGQWQPDQWCSPDLWAVQPEHVCYFKSNTVDASTRGRGVGSTLLKRSIQNAKKQGAIAGLAHIWLASPNNSAFRYFSQNGGELVKKHPNKWRLLSIEDDYHCPVCNCVCECTAAEMLLTFNK